VHQPGVFIATFKIMVFGGVETVKVPLTWENTGVEDRIGSEEGAPSR